MFLIFDLSNNLTMEPTHAKRAILIFRFGPRQSFEWEAELFANLVEDPSKDVINVSLGNVGTMTFMFTENPMGLIHANLNREYVERDLPLAVMLFTLEDGYAYFNLEGNQTFKKIIQDFRDQSGITERDRKASEKSVDTISLMTSDEIIDLALDQYEGKIVNMPQRYQDRLKKLNA